MTDSAPSARQSLFRQAAVFQIKLLVDGLRDAVLIPVSLVAALIGLARGGDDPGREFRRVLKFGRRSERWIDLFGHQPPLHGSRATGSLDTLLNRVEETVIEEYRRGRDPEEARKAIRAALEGDAGSAPSGGAGKPDQ